LLYVGRLAKEKNIELLFRALASAGDASLKLAVAGEGPLREELEACARALGVAPQTTFLGIVPRNDLPNFYASADAFVMPSTTETQGLVLAEALAAGAYVIAADAPQNRDVLGGAGVVVPPTPEAFAGALRDLAARPAGGMQAARAAAEGFSLEVQIDRILGLYEMLLRRVRIA
jgi:glycosyltransferase involved in cell wall biosynthesis